MQSPDSLLPNDTVLDGLSDSIRTTDIFRSVDESRVFTQQGNSEEVFLSGQVQRCYPFCCCHG